MSRLISDLDERIQANAYAFVDELTQKGIRYSILETYRTQLRQDALWAQGRYGHDIVNGKRVLAGLDIIGKDEASRIVTRAKHSLHTDKFAMDVAIIRPNGSIPWVVKDASIAALWMTLGEIGEQHGFEWGGRWADPQSRNLDVWGLGWDLPHFQRVL